MSNDGTPASTAVLTRDAQSASQLSDGLRFVASRLSEARALALTLAPPISPTADSAGLLYANVDARELYQLIAIDGTVHLYAGAWTAALLASLVSMLEPGGELVLPFFEPPDGRLSLAALSSLLGAEPLEVVEHYARFRPSDAPIAPTSLLVWAAQDFAGLVHGFLLARTLRRSTEVLMLDDMMLELLADSAELVSSGRRHLSAAGFEAGDRWFERPDDVEQIAYSAEYARMARMVAWHLVTAGRRAALVRAVLDAHDVPQAGSVVDLGGRYGFLAAELALDRALGAGRALVCDYSTAFLAAALQIYRAHRSLLHGRYQFSMHSVGDYELPADQRVVGLFGTLVDVPPEERSRLLARCREALADGGLLIVEQLLDAKSGTTEMELDEMLRTLGTVRAFTPHSFVELDARQTQPGSVRVVSA